MIEASSSAVHLEYFFFARELAEFGWTGAIRLLLEPK